MARDTRAEINRRLLEIVRSAGMSQADCVRATGLTSPAVSDWFNRGAVPDAATLARLALHLHVNGHWLLTGQGPRDDLLRREELYRLGAEAAIEDVRAMVAALEARWADDAARRRGESVAAFVRSQDQRAETTPGRRNRARKRRAS